MSRGRIWQVCRLDLRQNVKRPLFWIWFLIVAFFAWEMSQGELQIGSGDSSVGGKRSYVTSEFAFAQVLTFILGLIYPFFVAVAAGMTIIRDDELRVGEIIHSTPLRPAEYVLGKFLAVILSVFSVFGLYLLMQIVFSHVGTDAETAEFIGPFALANYVKPALMFGVPVLVFFSGTTFAVGELTRRPILVFLVPVALFLLCVFFLWNWSPSWLDPRINKVLMAVDPAGFRWINETWLSVDRGATFYNTEPIGYGLLFPLSRLGFLLTGLLGLRLSVRHFERRLRGTKKLSKRERQMRLGGEATEPMAAPRTTVPLAALGMRSRRPSFLSGFIAVTRAELRELRSQPGLYLFIPLILLFTVMNAQFALGAFDTPLLATPGQLAVRSWPWLTTLICLLLMFYLVESLRREASTGVLPIYYTTPVRTAALVLGKAFANSLVVFTTLFVALGSCAAVLAFQGTVAFRPEPFAIVWGLLLLPTFVVWSAFVATVYAVTSSRYTTYAAALGTLYVTADQLLTGEVHWGVNWPLWGALQWSDMGVLELTRTEVILNRALFLSLALFLIVLTLRVFPRRELDAARTVVRLRPRSLALGALTLVPFVLPCIVLWFVLAIRVDAGFQGDATEKAYKDYWRKNVATYTDFPVPDMTSVELELTLEPAARRFEAKGTYTLANRHDHALDRILLTANPSWEDLRWTMDSEEYEPEDRENLFVFTPASPLQPGEGVRIGFEHAGTVPSGATTNGGGASEFILPSGIVLTSFSPSFVPVLGYLEGIGVDDENKTDSKEYPDDFFEGVTDSAFGSGAPFSTRVTITAPEEYTMNSVGTLISETTESGRKTVVWESDHPVSFFNVVGGRYSVLRGEGTAIFHHPDHTYTSEEMLRALDASRRHYSEWFYPFPWQELKLSEFPALAGYAQGFPTNITFSESAGFLTRSTDEANAVFMVTAHEAAHQWWGNILLPGRGPGGNILSEGMAHFSTTLLFDEVLGLRERIGFLKQIESRYAETRQVDSERPLTKIDGSRDGDTTVTYDKGGWVAWMLANHMGLDRALEGCRSFIEHYSTDRDHPVLQDFVTHLRPFAPDPEAYDAFTDQWYFDVVVPQYKLSGVERAPLGGANGGGTGRYEVTLTIENVGTGTMPVDVAVSRGVRFPAENDSEDEGSEPAAPEEPYLEARVSVTLGPEESRNITIPCDFEPEHVTVDPDALVLQLLRSSASHSF